MNKYKVGDLFKIKPEVWKRDSEEHYIKWGKGWENPNAIIVLVEKLTDENWFVSTLSHPGQKVSHYLNELVPYKKLTVIL